MELKRLGVYGNVTEANLVKAKLSGYGIEAIVEADLMTDTFPGFDQLHGVEVLVKEEDLAQAYEVLERALPAGDD